VDALAQRYAEFLSMVESERHYYQELLDSLPAGVAIIGRNLRVVYSNRRFREMENGEQSNGDQVSAVTSEQVRDAIQNVLAAVESGEDVKPVSMVCAGEIIRIANIPVASKNGEEPPQALIFAVPAEVGGPTGQKQERLAEVQQD
jgi:nitrogen fixation/metabolism regulation signal transduction histidine kinase